MANNTVVYTSAGVAFILTILLFLVAWMQNSVNESRLLATPNIPKESAVFTSFASARINATADDVFRVVLNYKDYSKWSSFSQYEWAETDEDGAPLVGSKGSFKLSIEGFTEKRLPITLAVLDHAKRLVAERSSSYPSWLLASEHVQEVVPVQGHPRLCEYRTWHTLEGLAAYALLLIAQVEFAETQRTIAKNLKGYMEKSRAKTI